MTMIGSVNVQVAGSERKDPVSDAGAQKRSIGSTSAAIMVLATIMNTNRKQETGAADQMKVQDNWIVLYEKELEEIKDLSGVLNTGSINDEIAYSILAMSMNVNTRKEMSAQQQLEITSQMHLRDPSEANETAANTGNSFTRFYQAYAKVR